MGRNLAAIYGLMGPMGNQLRTGLGFLPRSFTLSPALLLNFLLYIYKTYLLLLLSSAQVLLFPSFSPQLSISTPSEYPAPVPVSSPFGLK